MIPVLRPSPDLRTRVWGGTRLGTGPGGEPIGEAWVAGPTSRVAGGATGAKGAADAPTLDELAARLGRGLVGSRSPWPDRFPLLVKFLDPADWLSVQVHPDDRLALRLAGPDGVGKTEAWYVLDAVAGAELLVGVQPDVADDRVRAAIRTGGLTALLERVPASRGDTVLVPAGTLHAVGPGLLLYELQQPSDLTYRADDWGRPATPERPLHIEETLAAWQPGVRPVIDHAVDSASVGRQELVRCLHFVMERLDARRGESVLLDPAGASTHIVTALAGSCVAIEGGDWHEEIGPLETVVVAAEAGPYRFATVAGEAGIALLARLPD